MIHTTSYNKNHPLASLFVIIEDIERGEHETPLSVRDAARDAVAYAEQYAVEVCASGALTHWGFVRDGGRPEGMPLHLWHSLLAHATGIRLAMDGEPDWVNLLYM